MEYNILITGVGGQGIVFVAKILGQAAFESGYKVRVGEIHGMSQRGGSVISYVRFGDSVYASMVPRGKGDVMIGLERLETLRYAEYMDENGCILLNNEKELPDTAEFEGYEYPGDEKIEKHTKKFADPIRFDAGDLAAEAGDKKVTNVVMVGALQALESFPIEEEVVKEAIRKQVPPDVLETNLEGFELGKEEIDDKKVIL
ncbi:hypothetical protein AKJ66_03430 [candidate division MSBL1 archaeon SCGC-AAA259E22]|uniref:Pyruvate/ketoisovalerate oxidoreductase catalytic domain-containing protein n=1 Tax=candidate division MSBL1 archaeon SCGC-AAA259E22 TaxID=1698265 RepID=A0A133UF65_9EURY|nr:hypothetical protein AKJ66_03430 [candidate division MSBL1 archaeon SCGC-AAA259E22]